MFLSGKSHGQRGLVGYSPWGRKELDTTSVCSVLQNIIDGNLQILKVIRERED